ncbi:MAG TPA: hypothetical protein VMB80_09240 [Candidatus Acidoferrum sp.]|nr:hypothetical protein [Candidatus Acidoferrum sp.]
MNAPEQFTFTLARVVSVDNRRRLVLLPDRMTAENELAKIKRQHGPAFVSAKISKNGTGPTGTYTVAYTVRETRTEELF